jgi:hypothetical protein
MLNHDKLIGLRMRGGKRIAQCPACAEDGGDRGQDHLFIAEDERFGCVANPGDHDHRRHIFALVGDREHRDVVMRLRDQIEGKVLETGVLGRLGRVFYSLAGAQKKESSHDIGNATPPKDFQTPVPSVPRFIFKQPAEDVIEAAKIMFNAESIPDDDLDACMRERLHMIEVILSQRDHQGRVSYTSSQIESCAIGLRRHAGTHPDVDSMLHRLNEAEALALGWREIERRRR